MEVANWPRSEKKCKSRGPPRHFSTPRRLGEFPTMMSASEGEGNHGKGRLREFYSVNQIKMRTKGGRRSKNPKILRTSYLEAPLSVPRILRTYNRRGGGSVEWYTTRAPNTPILLLKRCTPSSPSLLAYNMGRPIPPPPHSGYGGRAWESGGRNDGMMETASKGRPSRDDDSAASERPERAPFSISFVLRKFSI